MAEARILLAEDEPFIAETVKFSLESAGFECLLAADGIEAVDQARKKGPDLILLDVMLPRLDGHKVCRFLSNDEGCRNIPIIILTSRNQEKERDKALAAGANEFLIKPFEIGELLESIRRHLTPFLNPEENASV